MSNRKQRQQRADVRRTHIETEITRKVARADAFARGMYILSISSNGGISEILHPQILSYLADDLRDIRQLINERR